MTRDNATTKPISNKRPLLFLRSALNDFLISISIRIRWLVRESSAAYVSSDSGSLPPEPLPSRLSSARGSQRAGCTLHVQPGYAACRGSISATCSARGWPLRKATGRASATPGYWSGVRPSRSRTKEPHAPECRFRGRSAGT